MFVFANVITDNDLHYCVIFVSPFYLFIIFSMVFRLVLNPFYIATWILLSSQLLPALEAPLWVVQRKRNLYERNSVCMAEQKKFFDEYGMEQPFRAVVTPKKTTIWLKCFECLHPDDAEELEDVWKPSPSIIGRRIKNFLKTIRDKIIRSHSKTSRHGNLAAYIWERLNGDKVWDQAMDSFDNNRNQSAIINFMNEVMKKEKNEGKNFRIGDHFELEIRNIDKSYGGWYRCINRAKKDSQDKLNMLQGISQVYHVDVVDGFRTVMYNSTAPEDQMPEEVRKANFVNRTVNEDPLVELFWRDTVWTPCNRCGKKVGEKRRTKSCYLKRKWKVAESESHRYRTNVSEFAGDLYDLFSVFGELPCNSTLVPAVLKSQLSENFTIYEEFAECKVWCTPSKQNSGEVRTVAINETGREEVLDVLPPGEFTTNERLPPLAPPIIRRTIFANESGWLMMDCTNQDASALIWRKDSVELNATRIIRMEDGRARQRRVITSRGMLVIRSARLEDAGLYSCTAYPSGHILRTFRLFIDVGDRSRDVLEAISIAVRTLLILFLLMLLCDLLNVKVPNV